MTLCKSEYYSGRHISMTGEPRASRPKTGTKRTSSQAYRVFDYQRVPASVMPVPMEPSAVKRTRPSSSSSTSSSSSVGLRRKSSRPGSKSEGGHTGSSSAKAKFKMAELLAIKRELTVIKVQIDGLLDSVDKMDRQSKAHSESPPTKEGDAFDSPYYGSLSSLENSPVSHLHRQRESPEPGEASDDDQPQYPYNNYHPHHLQHRISNYQSDLGDDM